MDLNEESIKKLEEFLTNPITAKLFFDHFDDFYKTSETNVEEAQNLINRLKGNLSSESN